MFCTPSTAGCDLATRPDCVYKQIQALSAAGEGRTRCTQCSSRGARAPSTKHTPYWKADSRGGAFCAHSSLRTKHRFGWTRPQLRPGRATCEHGRRLAKRNECTRGALSAVSYRQVVPAPSSQLFMQMHKHVFGGRDIGGQLMHVCPQLCRFGSGCHTGTTAKVQRRFACVVAPEQHLDTERRQ